MEDKNYKKLYEKYKAKYLNAKNDLEGAGFLSSNKIYGLDKKNIGKFLVWIFNNDMDSKPDFNVPKENRSKLQGGEIGKLSKEIVEDLKKNKKLIGEKKDKLVFIKTLIDRYFNTFTQTKDKENNKDSETLKEMIIKLDQTGKNK